MNCCVLVYLELNKRRQKPNNWRIRFLSERLLRKDNFHVKFSPSSALFLWYLPRFMRDQLPLAVRAIKREKKSLPSLTKNWFHDEERQIWIFSTSPLCQCLCTMQIRDANLDYVLYFGIQNEISFQWRDHSRSHLVSHRKEAKWKNKIA